VRRAVIDLANEGDSDPRGREIDALLETLAEGRKSTLRGVLCTGGAEWRFEPAPQRKLKR